MVRTGEVYENRVTGERAVIEERFTMLRGRVGFRLAGRVAIAEQLFQSFDERESLIRAMLVTRASGWARMAFVEIRIVPPAIAPLTRRMPQREARAFAASSRCS